MHFLLQRHTFILLFFVHALIFQINFFLQGFCNQRIAYISFLNILLIKGALLFLEVFFFKGACSSTIHKMFPKGESSSYWDCQWE